MDILTYVASYVLCFIGGWVAGKCREDYRGEYRKSKSRTIMMRPTESTAQYMMGKHRSREN